MSEDVQTTEQAEKDAVQQPPIDKVALLRETLKNGRSNNRASAGTSGDGEKLDRSTTSDVTASRSSIQTASRQSGTTESDSRGTTNNKPSIATKPLGVRRPTRRFSENNSSPITSFSDSEPTRDTARREPTSTGRLEPDSIDLVNGLRPLATFTEDNARTSTLEPEQPKRGPGRPAKPKPETPVEKSTSLPWFKQQSTLTDKEAKDLEEPLIAALGDYMGYMDDYIWAVTEDTEQVPVWSDGDEDEVKSLARMFLKRAKRSAAAATMVRAMVEGDDYVTAAMFVIPRVVTTTRRLRNAPKKEKKPRGRRLRVLDEA